MQFAQRGVWGGWKPHKYWVFPHYTWGYIEVIWTIGNQNDVPSLYVRVYRHNDRQFDIDKGSLTIREGISEFNEYKYIVLWFPHYTWGYIAPFSLITAAGNCSLTIREGISGEWVSEAVLLMFPHYTWGYIICHAYRRNKDNVPSLYVRVYRTKRTDLTQTLCSLTIREGISLKVGALFMRQGFPHYTWGYIGTLKQFYADLKVPSLYVRVYRLEVNLWKKEDGSLTIREGISQMFSAMERQALFPHYTWGYIADFCGKIWSMLRSLTIREGISMSTI